MPIGAAIGGAAVIGGVATSNAAKKSAKAVTSAADSSNATQLAIYNQNRTAAQPYVDGGSRSFDAWQSMMGLTPGDGGAGYNAFKASTGYQTALDEGYRGLRATSAARGNLLSGAAGREAVRYGQNYATNFANGYTDRLMQGTQIGTGATSALAGVGTNYANAVSQTNTNAANALSSSYAAQGNAMAGTANSLAGAFAYGFGNNFGKTPNMTGSSYSAKSPNVFGGF